MSKTEKRTSSRFWQWLVNDDSFYSEIHASEREQIDSFRLSIFIALHLGCLLVFVVGGSWFALGFALFLYFLRMFFITAFYHRYFSHRSYSVSRLMQFFMAAAGCMAGQRGPLWWASHHREHHLTSDTEKDPHSPKHGFLNSHTLWFLKKGNFSTNRNRIKDFSRYPELNWLERFDWIPFMGLALLCYALGEGLQNWFPGLNTSGGQLLVWGFFISTVMVYHGTYVINSLCHRYGWQRFNTKDDSRNNLLLALLTLGEGWHNNHHRYPVSTRQGFYWWEIDLSYFALWCMSRLGLVSDMKPVPAYIFREAEEGVKK